MYRLAVSLGGSRDALNPNALRGRLRAADEGGVDSVWVGESWGPDAITQLALAAAWTERVQIGSSIVNVYSRTPGALAQHFATLDVVSGGRMIIGLGTSGANVIEHFHGLPFDRPLRRLREYVEIINLLIAGEPLHYTGEIFNLQRGFTLRFEPVRRHIPIAIAALTPASVRQTARIADGWLPIWTPLDRLAAEIASFRQTAVQVGRDPAAVTVRAPGAIVVTPNVERARQAARGTLAFYIARMGVFYFRHLERLGYEAEAAAVKAAWDQGGASAGAAAVPDALIDAMTLITDSVEAARERLAAQHKAGVDLHQVSVERETPEEQARVYAALV